MPEMDDVKRIGARPVYPELHKMRLANNESAEMGIVRGISLREYYAGLIMASCVAAGADSIYPGDARTAETAVRLADALLVEIAK